MVESGSLEDRKRHRHVFPQDVPPHAADAAERDRLDSGRDALG
jgi:hypothetical protein